MKVYVVLADNEVVGVHSDQNFVKQYCKDTNATYVEQWEDRFPWTYDIPNKEEICQ